MILESNDVPEGPIRAAAREILKVNSYDAMREALELLVKRIHTIQRLKDETYWDEDDDALMVEQAEAALKIAKLAKGE